MFFAAAIKVSKTSVRFKCNVARFFQCVLRGCSTLFYGLSKDLGILEGSVSGLFASVLMGALKSLRQLMRTTLRSDLAQPLAVASLPTEVW